MNYRLVGMQHDAIDIESDLPNEYLYGRAGYLYALLFVNKHVHPPPVNEALIRKVILYISVLNFKIIIFKIN